MSHSVRRHLRLEISAYDETIRRLIPGYEIMLGVAADAVAAAEPDLVCDLGAGTGALSEELLARRAVGTVELLDVDAEMMDQSRQRLQRFGDRVRFTLRSYHEPFSSCDAFAAALSLHHIRTIEAKSAMYGQAFAALRPGGVLVNADAHMPVEPTERDRLFRYWVDHMVASGISEQRAWKHFEDWAEEDAYLPLDVELAALTRIGFDADSVWSDGPIRVVVAKKG